MDTARARITALAETSLRQANGRPDVALPGFMRTILRSPDLKRYVVERYFEEACRAALADAAQTKPAPSGATLGEHIRAKGTEIGAVKAVADGGGHRGIDAQVIGAPAEPSGRASVGEKGAVQPRGDAQKKFGRPLPLPAATRPKVMSGRAKQPPPGASANLGKFMLEVARHSILNTHLVNGRPIKDCTAGEVRSAARRNAKSARFELLLVSGLTDAMIVSERVTPDYAEWAWKEANIELPAASAPASPSPKHGPKSEASHAA